MRSIILIFFLVLSAITSFCQDSFPLKLSEAAIELTRDRVKYDPGYYSIPYPNGDVPRNIGVCTDVVIRAYRKLGIDLQKEVYHDMKAHFSIYPQKWGRKTTDRNIDHRRVPNLMVFFKRKGLEKPITANPDDYLPGDVVAWSLPRNLAHIGLVVNKRSSDGKRFLIVHNIGAGQVLSDCLFAYRIIGHYSYRKKIDWSAPRF